MNDLETRLKELIISRYGSLKKFTDIIEMPWTTLDSILKRGVSNSNITNILRITKELGIDTESLVSGDIIDINRINKNNINNPALTKQEQNHLHKYRSVDDKGKHTVDTVLEMEYNRCNKPHLVVNAAHAIKGATKEDKKHDDELMDNEELWK